MANLVGIDVELVSEILSQLEREISDMTDLIANVGTVGKSIEEHWSGNAASMFDASMQDFVSKANETIPVLESIRDWVRATANEYAAQDEAIANLFSGYMN